MSKTKLLLLSVAVAGVCFVLARVAGQTERPMVVVIPSYKNSDWYDKNLSSVFDQNYRNYRVLYIEDCSPDDTYDLVMQKIMACGQEWRTEVIRNETRKGALANIYNAVHSCKDDEIVVLLDGDDWFKHDQVLATVNRAYQDENIWMTYGQYEEYPKTRMGQCRTVPSQVIQQNAYRRYHWVTTHLRTCYVWLFKRIKKEDLMYQGEFFSTCGDLAFMFPMLEMAAGRWKFIEDVLYVYNMDTPLNDYKVRFELQQFYDRLIRNANHYDPLEKPLVKLCA